MTDSRGSPLGSLAETALEALTAVFTPEQSGKGGDIDTDSAPNGTRRSDIGAATDRARRPLTDGGSEDVAPADLSWGDDDPIVFEEGTPLGDDDADPLDADSEMLGPDDDLSSPEAASESALLDAVTDDTLEDADAGGAEVAPGSAGGVDAETHDPAETAASDERLDELEARIGALESDHAQLEGAIADVAGDIGDLRADVSMLGEDLQTLVALFGGMAATAGRTDPVETGSPPTGAERNADSEVEAVGTAPPDGDDPSRSDEAPGGSTGQSPEDTDERQTSTRDEDAEAEFDDEATPSEGVPDGINRGVDPGGVDASPEPFDSAAATGGEQTEEPVDHGAMPGAAPVETTGDGTDPTADQGSEGQDSSGRSLVDPRTDAVGARLRQFREGFVDDPTEDLPTGDAADEFRFDKVLLPADGDEAPDLSGEDLEKPYLAALPNGFAADAVVLEWLDWLVSAGDAAAAAQAVAYYEDVDWITGEVADELYGYLDGLDPEGRPDAAAGPPDALDLQDHLRSLQYVTELATGEVGGDGV